MAQILSNQWILKRRPHWDRLAGLLAQSDASGLGQLSRAELQELALLYRQVAADLSVLRQDPTSRTYAQHVNQLLARAHHIIYSGRKTNLAHAFSLSARRVSGHFSAPDRLCGGLGAVFVSFGLLGAALTSARPEFMRHFVGPEMIATMERHEMWTESVVSVAPMASSCDHDQQPFGQLCHLCRRNRLRAGNLLLSAFKRHDAGGDRRGLPPLRACRWRCGALWRRTDRWSCPRFSSPAGRDSGWATPCSFPARLRWRESVARGGIEATRLVSRHHSPAGHRRLPGGFLLSVASSRLAQVHRGRRAVLAAAAVALPAGQGTTTVILALWMIPFAVPVTSTL